MQCPNDQSTLVMSERKGIEVDYCPTCRGVWLDRGELDKIIDRSLDELGSAGGQQTPPPSPMPQYPPQPGARPAPAAYPEPARQDPRFAYPPRRRYGSSASAGSPDDYGYGGGYRGNRRRRRKNSFLGELFDF